MCISEEGASNITAWFDNSFYIMVKGKIRLAK